MNLYVKNLIPVLIFLIFNSKDLSALTKGLTEKSVCVISIPKCGTYLALKCIQLLRPDLEAIIIDQGNEEKILKTLKKPTAIVSHMLHNAKSLKLVKNNQLTKFFIYRDPRDQIISFAYWVKSHPKEYPALTKLGMPSLITTLITTLLPKRFTNQIKWMKEKNIHSIKFENLVGTKGGGSNLRQAKEIQGIGEHLGLKINNHKIAYVMNNIWGDSSSFRSGKSGSWKKYFTENQKTVFKHYAGKLLIELGYEKDFNW